MHRYRDWCYYAGTGRVNVMIIIIVVVVITIHHHPQQQNCESKSFVVILENSIDAVSNLV